MRAISSFSLEAGTSTFWCRARIALRIRASMSATGSVKFIALLLLGHSFSPFQRRTSNGPCSAGSLARVVVLPRRFRNAGNFTAQCQPAETQAAESELAQIPTRTSADLAAVMPARRKLELLPFGASIRKLLLDFLVLHSFCCGCQLSS